ncbi:helix-turn-helix domain-containing protein [Tenacibaculum caenipelagi]|uniref:HTH cro/C1-type domain-containing protein n=1 Tax=Tenacibaculum caenipelagi TaxID=1325435 RepID=A0A4R6TG35_9FLAO|nr:helix-turn-helix transcriptional regulator [Tenacibaculum caenipelagi]TDQ27686.1 hypothetical protein DFQ07_1537 [Tenacibaculum caenipelagi]
MEIHNRIEQIMNSKGLNYRSLGILIGYSDSQTRNVVLGKSIPKVDFIQSLLRVFPEIDVKWLITGEESNFNQKEIAPNNIEAIAISVFDNWDIFMKDRLFKANFESKAASWALNIKKEHS